MIAHQWLGKAEYNEVLAQQLRVRDSIVSGAGLECILTGEHYPVVTLGRRRGEVESEALRRENIPVVSTRRGGLATYHGPGQLIVYPIIHLSKRRIGVRDFVCGIQRCVIAYLSELGISASSDSKYPGVWVGTQKIGAIGLNVSSGVSIHGLSLNVSNSLKPFQFIEPCGIADRGVTSVKSLLGSSPLVQTVASNLSFKINEWLKNIDEKAEKN